MALTLSKPAPGPLEGTGSNRGPTLSNTSLLASFSSSKPTLIKTQLRLPGYNVPTYHVFLTTVLTWKGK